MENECFVFNYKGSQGNENRFVTYKDCMMACMKESDESAVESEETFLPKTARILTVDFANYNLDESVEQEKMTDEDICSQGPPEELCGFGDSKFIKLLGKTQESVSRKFIAQFIIWNQLRYGYRWDPCFYKTTPVNLKIKKIFF